MGQYPNRVTIILASPGNLAMIRRTVLVLVLVAAVNSAAPAAEARLLRFPAIHGDRVAFTYAGNLYTGPGGRRRRPADDQP